MQIFLGYIVLHVKMSYVSDHNLNKIIDQTLHQFANLLPNWTLLRRFWPYYQILEVSIEHSHGCG